MSRDREPRAAAPRGVKRTANRPTAGSQRPLRVGEALRHALSKVLRENTIHDAELAKRNVTVSEVRMSPDLRHANVFIVPFAGGDADPVLADLKRTTPLLRREMAAALQLRYVPDMHFMLDTSFDYAEGINRALSSPLVARDLTAEEQAAADAEAAAEDEDFDDEDDDFDDDDEDEEEDK